MNGRCFNYKKIMRQIKQRFIASIVLILALLIARQLIIQYGNSQNEYRSLQISYAQEQKVLCQKIVKDALAIYNIEDSQSMVEYLEQLEKSTKAWKRSYTNLKTGNLKEGVPSKNSEKVMGVFADMEESFQEVLDSTYSIPEVVKRETYYRSFLSYEINIIQSNEEKFLGGMKQIVDQYEKENGDEIKQIRTTDTILFWITIGAIIFVVKYVYQPSQDAIFKAFEEIKESNENIIKIFKMTPGALYLIDEHDFEILLTNNQAEKLIKVHENKDKVRSFAEEIQWVSVNPFDIMEKIRSDEKIENLEVTINQEKDKSITALLSSAKGKYNGTPVILIGLFDITLQKQAEEKMKSLAITDELTGLYNRHYLDYKLKEEILREERYNVPLSMLIFDMDFFKKINDKWGHPVGDEVLKQTAQIASQNIRKTDFLVRLGGEEFLLLMPHTNINGAMLVAEKICEGIENYGHPLAGINTASFGIGQKKKMESAHEFYKRVDAALYRAKEGGRNRIFISECRGSLPFVSMKFEWKNEWNSGNLHLDQQHQELLYIANQLINMSLISDEIENATRQFDIMVQYFVQHFEYEESVTVDIGYPDYIEHAKIHKELIQKLEQLKQSYEKEELKLSAIFSFIMDELIVGHLLEEDVKFFPYISYDYTV